MPGVLLAIAAWSAQFGIVIATATIALAGTGLRSPRARLAVWQATLVAALVAPFVAISVLPNVPAVFDTGKLVLTVPGTGGVVRAAALERSSSVLLACLAAGLAVRAGWMLIGWRRLHRWSVMEAASSPVFDEAAAQLGVDARLVCGNQGASPFTFGWRTPTRGSSRTRTPRVRCSSTNWSTWHVATGRLSSRRRSCARCSGSIRRHGGPRPRCASRARRSWIALPPRASARVAPTSRPCSPSAQLAIPARASPQGSPTVVNWRGAYVRSPWRSP